MSGWVGGSEVWYCGKEIVSALIDIGGYGDQVVLVVFTHLHNVRYSHAVISIRTSLSHTHLLPLLQFLQPHLDPDGHSGPTCWARAREHAREGLQSCQVRQEGGGHGAQPNARYPCEFVKR